MTQKIFLILLLSFSIIIFASDTTILIADSLEDRTTAVKTEKESPQSKSIELTINTVLDTNTNAPIITNSFSDLHLNPVTKLKELVDPKKLSEKAQYSSNSSPINTLLDERSTTEKNISWNTINYKKIDHDVSVVHDTLFRQIDYQQQVLAKNIPK